jgi:hypothetical protein
MLHRDLFICSKPAFDCTLGVWLVDYSLQNANLICACSIKQRSVPAICGAKEGVQI